MMGNPAYDARREAEREEAERDKAMATAAKETFEVITAFCTGRAYICISKGLSKGLTGEETVITIGRR